MGNCREQNIPRQPQTDTGNHFHRSESLRTFDLAKVECKRVGEWVIWGLCGESDSG
jgi:hypothetical protein